MHAQAAALPNIVPGHAVPCARTHDRGPNCDRPSVPAYRFRALWRLDRRDRVPERDEELISPGGDGGLARGLAGISADSALSGALGSVARYGREPYIRPISARFGAASPDSRLRPCRTILHNDGGRCKRFVARAGE